MKCENCGTELKEKQRYCHVCGFDSNSKVVNSDNASMSPEDIAYDSDVVTIIEPKVIDDFEEGFAEKIKWYYYLTAGALIVGFLSSIGSLVELMSSYVPVVMKICSYIPEWLTDIVSVTFVLLLVNELRKYVSGLNVADTAKKAINYFFFMLIASGFFTLIMSFSDDFNKSFVIIAMLLSSGEIVFGVMLRPFKAAGLSTALIVAGIADVIFGVYTLSLFDSWRIDESDVWIWIIFGAVALICEIAVYGIVAKLLGYAPKKG